MSTRSPTSADLVSPINAMNDTKLVQEQSKTHPHECEEKLTPESITNMLPDRMQNKSPDSPDGITVGSGEVCRPPDHLGYQEAAITGEGEQECTSYQHAVGKLFVEDVGQHMAVLPEVDTTLCEMTIEDLQVSEPGVPLTKEQEELRQLIRKKRHLLMGKGNSLPPAARGGICDKDVGGATPTNNHTLLGPSATRKVNLYL
uniref:Uncharacterized protein n=1 Tax=Peronospora matthiolae TaxID=2874970 RepID=A0AAV1UAC7_9STRA